YHFKILAQDSLANATTTGDNTFTTTAQAENVVISEIKIGNVGEADDEWIELYNPTNADIDLESLPLKLHIRNSVGTESNKIINFTHSVIPAKGFFLLASATNYTGGVPADATYSTSGIKLVSDGGIYISMSAASSTNIIDQAGWGSQPVGGYEVAPFAPSPCVSTSVICVNSLERKAFSNSTSSAMVNGIHQWQGNGYDSDNNSQDFVLQNNPNPQNSLMLTEPRSSLPNLMTASAWPTWQKDLARTGLSSATSLATSTMAVKWTATTTANHGFVSRPALDDQGNIYIGREDGLAKYSPSDGSLLWLNASSTSYTVPLILSDGSVLVRGPWELSAFTSDGRLKWKFLLDGSAGANAHLAILSDGTIITQSAEKVMAINQDATLKWIFNPGPGRAMQNASSISAPVVDSSDNIYIVIDTYLYAISSSGSALLWSPLNLGRYSSLALDSVNNIIYFTVGTTWPQGALYALNVFDGSIVWSNNLGNNYNDHAELAPAIDSSGQVYTIMFYSGGIAKLEAYLATSTPSWTTAHLGSASLAAPIVTVDIDGKVKIYVAGQATISIFNAADGVLLGIFNKDDVLGLGNLYSYFGAVGSDGTIYTADSSTLYAIDDN
ncbi:MAG: PQQ-binding-like beta-propeller repeat protein, partial [bacterium]|nr:PQQ-binding-like beta-propeller repeat protein [bacterium]